MALTCWIARHYPNRRGLLLVPLLALLLSGCPGGARPGTDAESSVRQGRYQEAARGYERLAAAASGAERDQYHLDASRAWLEAGQVAKALATMERVSPPLPRNDSAIGILLAYRALRDGSAIQSLSLLDGIRNGLPERYNALWYELRGRAYYATGDASAGAGALVEREIWLGSEDAILANREILWRGLGELASGGNELTPDIAASDITRGWLNLATALQRGQIDPYTAGREIRQWQESHDNHPAQFIALRMLAPLPDAVEYPSTVAVLLPLSGGLGGSAAAVRDGLMAAWLGDALSERRPTIRFYDTGRLSPTTALQTALADGAEFIVGPLHKNAVQEIADEHTAITILALNYLGDEPGPRSNFFQFSLAPEHEAAQVARRAIDEGLQTAVALVPDTGWGSRLLSAFAQSLAQYGGVLLDHRVYETSSSDFGGPITELLNLDESRERYRQVAAVTGLRLEFEPRRREDVDFVFVAGNARQGRQIRPAFSYHFAEDLPIFSTSAIFEDDAARNGRDLDGIVFADMPWIIAPDEAVRTAQIAYSRYWPNRVNRRGRLYALGFDAYRLIPQLMSTDNPLAAPWPGTSGKLSMGIGGRIERELDVAQIRNGLAIGLPPIHEVEPFEPQLEMLFPVEEDNTGL